jgi:hypothetical protein
MYQPEKKLMTLTLIQWPKETFRKQPIRHCGGFLFERVLFEWNVHYVIFEKHFYFFYVTKPFVTKFFCNLAFCN